jgi:hypothetical protein
MALKGLKYFTKNWILPPAFYNLLKEKEKIVRNALVEKTKSAKDRHIGKRCFILGTGSSVKDQDLKKLIGEYVISVSNAYVHPDYHLFKPQYHVLPHLLLGHSNAHSVEALVKWLKDMDEKIYDAEMFLHYGDKKMIDENNILTKRKIHWLEYCGWDEDFNAPIDPSRIPKLWSVSEIAITMAIYMGFDKIYLLGFDHDWYNGPHVYFFDEKNEHKLHSEEKTLGYNPAYFHAEYQMQRHAQIFKKYRYLYNMKKNIYNANANQNTYVDTFPKVDFNSLFEK